MKMMILNILIFLFIMNKMLNLLKFYIFRCMVFYIVLVFKKIFMVVFVVIFVYYL